MKSSSTLWKTVTKLASTKKIPSLKENYTNLRDFIIICMTLKYSVRRKPSNSDKNENYPDWPWSYRIKPLNIFWKAASCWSVHSCKLKRNVFMQSTIKTRFRTTAAFGKPKRQTEAQVCLWQTWVFERQPLFCSGVQEDWNNFLFFFTAFLIFSYWDVRKTA